MLAKQDDDMKTLLCLSAATFTACAFAQSYPPMPPRPGMQNQTQRTSGYGQTAGSATIPSETIRLLGLKSVQQEISMTSDEYTALVQLASTLPAATTTEDQAFTAVSKVLTTTQSAKLEQFLIQDLGYGSLSLSDVRTKLSLSKDQTTQIDALLASFEAAKKSIIGLNSSASATVQAISQVATSTNLSLEAVLTADQRTKLKSLS